MPIEVGTIFCRLKHYPPPPPLFFSCTHEPKIPHNKWRPTSEIYNFYTGGVQARLEFKTTYFDTMINNPFFTKLKLIIKG